LSAGAGIGKVRDNVFDEAATRAWLRRTEPVPLGRMLPVAPT